jgi:hypothetical protein
MHTLLQIGAPQGTRSDNSEEQRASRLFSRCYFAAVIAEKPGIARLTQTRSLFFRCI